MGNNVVAFQGVGSVPASQLNVYVQTCTTAPVLRTFVGQSGMQVDLQGIATPGDGNGGAFLWNATSAGPDDNLNIIVPFGVTVGAWVRFSLGSGGGPSPLPANYALTSAAIFLANPTLVLIDCNCAANNVSVVLPAPNLCPQRTISVCKIDTTASGFVPTVSSTAGVLFNGAATFTFPNIQWYSLTVMPAGALAWRIL